MILYSFFLNGTFCAVVSAIFINTVYHSCSFLSKVHKGAYHIPLLI